MEIISIFIHLFNYIHSSVFIMEILLFNYIHSSIFIMEIHLFNYIHSSIFIMEIHLFNYSLWKLIHRYSLYGNSSIFIYIKLVSQYFRLILST
jgi:hypothetical protein